MPQKFRRSVIVGVGAVAVGILAVACSGSPRIGPTVSGMQATVGGVSVRLPGLPFQSTTSQTSQQTVTHSQTGLEGATHSGEGCPIALPQ